MAARTLSTDQARRVIRPEIRRSWERSEMCGLDRGTELRLPYEPDLQAEERFMRAATPVLDDVGELLHCSRTSAVLIDAHGRLLMRRCGERELVARLDDTQSIPGFRWTEEHSGTTAVSIALEERMPTLVTGREHFLEALGHLACAAVPIVHPITQRLQGVLDVTALLPDASPHMMPVVLQAARAIEERLYEDASTAERELLQRFLAASRPGRAVVVLNDRIELSTPVAARMLEVSDRTLLWERARGMGGQAGMHVEAFPLADGREVGATFQTIEQGDRVIGVVVELEPRAPDAVGAAARVAAPASKAGADGQSSAFLGRSSAARYLREYAAELSKAGVTVLVAGEAGVGKLTLAKTIAGPGDDRVLLDAARTTLDGEASLLRQLAGIVDVPGRVAIVRRIGCLSEQALHALIAIAASAEPNHSRVIATVTSTQDGSEDAITSSFGVKVEVPPLRERADDLLDLVPHLIARRGATARMAPAAIQALMRYDWPGNVRELDGLVRALLTRKQTTDIVPADLPSVYQRGNRRLRRIEHVERAAIVQALLEVGGNKTKAAELLEIGRATLYRKMRAYGLDIELTTS